MQRTLCNGVATLSGTVLLKTLISQLLHQKAMTGVPPPKTIMNSLGYEKNMENNCQNRERNNFVFRLMSVTGIRGRDPS